MSPKEFIAWLQGYYGEIPPGQREDLVEYLRPLASTYLAALRESVKRCFSSQYGKVPDIAVFESCKQDAFGRQAEIQDLRSGPLLEAPPERGAGELMAIDWDAVFARTLARSREFGGKGHAEA